MTITTVVAHHRQTTTSLTFPDQCQIPWLFQVFEVSGHPELFMDKNAQKLNNHKNQKKHSESACLCQATVKFCQNSYAKITSDVVESTQSESKSNRFENKSKSDQDQVRVQVQISRSVRMSKIWYSQYEHVVKILAQVTS